MALPNGIIGNMYTDLSAASAFSHISFSSIAASNSEGSSTAIPLALLSSATFLLCFFIRTRFTRSLTDLAETEKWSSDTALRLRQFLHTVSLSPYFPLAGYTDQQLALLLLKDLDLSSSTLEWSTLNTNKVQYKTADKAYLS